MKIRGNLLIIFICGLCALTISACTAERNNPNDPGADNYSGGDDTADGNDVYKSWHDAIQISSSDYDYYNFSCVDMGVDGFALAVWVAEDSTAKTSIRARAFSPEYKKGWDTNIVTIDEDANDSFLTPDIAVNGKNEAAVIYTGEGSSTNYVFARFFDPGSGWGNIEGLTSSSVYYNSPDIDINNDGNAVAVWKYGGAPSTVEACFWDGSIWDSAQTLHSDTSFAPSVKIDSYSNAIAVMENDGATEGGIFTHYYSGGWDSQYYRLDTSTDADEPRLAMNSEGVTMMIWKDSIEYYIKGAVYMPSFGWSSWDAPSSVGIIHESTVYPDNPQVAINDSNAAVIVWTDNDSGGVYAMYNSEIGTPGQAPEKIDNSSGYPFGANVAIDEGGVAMAVWTDDNGVYACKYDPAINEWEEPLRIDGGGQFANSMAQIAMDDSGNATVVWNQDNMTSVWAARYE